MKKLLIILIGTISYFASAQSHLAYQYDQSGNRTQRRYLVPRLANPSLLETKYGISVFPNPTSDNINVNISLLEEGESAKIFLSDEQGKNQLMMNQSTKLVSLDLGNLKAGIYYIKIYIKEESVSYKIVKL